MMSGATGALRAETSGVPSRSASAEVGFSPGPAFLNLAVSPLPVTLEDGLAAAFAATHATTLQAFAAEHAPAYVTAARFLAAWREAKAGTGMRLRVAGAWYSAPSADASYALDDQATATLTGGGDSSVLVKVTGGESSDPGAQFTYAGFGLSSNHPQALVVSAQPGGTAQGEVGLALNVHDPQAVAQLLSAFSAGTAYRLDLTVTVAAP